MKKNIVERKLAVINDRKEKIAEKIFSLAGSDGGEFLPLYGIDADESNIFQYTGHLFKGKPPVIFGFIAQSFGCPSINFLDQRRRISRLIVITGINSGKNLFRFLGNVEFSGYIKGIVRIKI